MKKPPVIHVPSTIGICNEILDAYASLYRLIKAPCGDAMKVQNLVFELLPSEVFSNQHSFSDRVRIRKEAVKIIQDALDQAGNEALEEAAKIADKCADPGIAAEIRRLKKVK